MGISEQDLMKLLSSALSACKAAEAGDSAEEGRAVDALKLLSNQEITTEVLSKTEAGKVVKKLGKHTKSSISSAAAAVVEAWKQCVRREQAKKKDGLEGSKSGDLDKGTASNNSRPMSVSLSQAPSLSQTPSLTQVPSLSQAPSLNRSDSGPLSPAPSPHQGPLNLKPARSGDSTRDKIRVLLAEALAGGLSPDVFGDPCALAVEVEDAMYAQSGGMNPKYKAKFRSLSFNLKDPNNPSLRIKVLRGEIPGDILVQLSAEELASDDRRQSNDKVRDHMKLECVRGQQDMPSTDMFQCGKCRQKKTTYYQLQTRSADEPMTTFVTCVACGNRWKFC